MKKAFHRKLPGHPIEDQRKLTITKIPDERDSWSHGSGAETIHTLTESFKARTPPHELYLGMDIRVLGDSDKDIHAAVDVLTKAGVKITDLSNLEDDTVLKMYRRAQAASRWNGDRRRQKSKGAKGGKVMQKVMNEKRNAIMAKDVIIRLCAHPKLTWQDCADIMGPEFSVKTLQRNYAVKDL